MNPNSADSTVDVTYVLEGGGLIERTHVVPGHSRYTIAAHHPAEVGPGFAFSTALLSDVPIIAERSMYWAEGGHCASGAVNRERSWMFPEGSTADGFEFFILIMNPEDWDASATLTYSLEGGDTVVREHTIPANSRYTIAVHDPAELGPGFDFSATLESDSYIVVERAMYWPGGGHASLGSIWTSQTWFLAEGYTGAGFSTFLVLYNPFGGESTARVTYLLQGGGRIERTYSIAGRRTILTNDPAEVGPDAAFSVFVDESWATVVERVMYWADGGHSTIGAPWPQNAWELPEGYTDQGFETFILIGNPSDVDANVEVTYLLEGGGMITRDHFVPAGTRYTILANNPAEVGPGVAFSTLIEANTWIVAERAMYWPGGGHVNIGAYWY